MTTTALPALVQAAVDNFKAKLPPGTDGDLDNLLSDVFAAGQSAVDAGISAEGSKVPLLGPLAAAAVKAGANKALADAEAEIEAWAAAQLPETAQ